MQSDLVRVAEQHCGFKLSDAEHVLLAALAAGQPASFAQEERLRATLLRWILTSEQTRKLTAESGLRIDRAVVAENLDLRGTSIACNARFRRVRFEDDIFLSLARLQSLIFEACTLKRVDMQDARLDGTFVLEEYEGEGNSLGALSLRDAKISGNVDIRYSTFRSHEGTGEHDGGLDLVRATIEGSLFITPGNTIAKGVDASSSRIEGSVLVVDLDVIGSPSRPALIFNESKVKGSLVICRSLPKDQKKEDGPPVPGRTSIGAPVVVNHAHVGGNIDLVGLYVRCPASTAELPWGIDLLGTHVDGSIWLNHAVVWNAGARLSHVRVGGSVECDDLLLMREDRAQESEAQPATIAATSETVERRERVGFQMDSAMVGQNFVWRVILPDAELVNLAGSKFGTFLYASSYWRHRSNLQAVTFERLFSTSYPFRWPRLVSFVRRVFRLPTDWRPKLGIAIWMYDRVFAGDRTHLGWLRTASRKDWEFDEGLYDSVAATLTRQGQRRDAKRVHIARVNDANVARGWLAVVLGVPYRIFVGNGYRPYRAVVWALGLIALGSVVFGRAYTDGTLVKVDADAVSQPFHAVMYSADTLLPIIDLHQETSFEASGPGSDAVRAYLWAQIIIGWIIATTLGAAAANFVRRVDSA